MKKYLLFLLPMMALVLITSCKPKEDDTPIEPTTSVDLVFKANYGTEVGEMQKEFTYGDGKAIKFVQFDFFVSNMALMKDNTPNSAETELKEIDYVKLSFTETADAESGYTISINNIPAGTYEGLKIGLGVPADLNNTQPEDYGSSHVLSENYWYGDWSSYVFTKIEAAADLNEDGSIVIGGLESEGLSYHAGTDAVYQELIIPQTIVLTEGVPFQINLNLDLAQAFLMDNPAYDANGDGYLDINTFIGTHDDTTLGIAEKIMENLANSVTIDF